MSATSSCLLVLALYVALLAAAAADPIWYTCPIYTLHFDANVTQTAQCSIFSLPFSPQTPDQTLDIFVKRMTSPTSTKALWMLDGGPGLSSEDMEGVMLDFFQRLEGDADVYLYDHRGTGRSTRFECVAPQPEVAGSEGGAQMTGKKYPDCLKSMKQRYGERTKDFSTTEAARDILNVIKTVNTDKQVFVYGISYGTYLTNRLKQLDEDSGNPVIQGVILDGVVCSTGEHRLTFNDYDPRFSQTGLDLLNLCLKDNRVSEAGASCGSYFKKSGNQTAEALLKQMYDSVFNKNKCPIATKYVTEASLKKILGGLVMERKQRQLLPALLYRLLRCEPELDEGVLNFFFNKTTATSMPTCKSLTSDPLRLNVMFGELIDATTFNEEYLQRVFNESLIARGQLLPTAAPAYQSFKDEDMIYTPDPKFFNKAFSTNTASVLLINGDLDPQTHAAYAVAQAEAIQAPQKKLVIIPYAPHVTITESPVSDSPVHCGTQLVVNFVKDPTKELDTTCTQHVIPPNFDGEEELNMKYFGVKNIWEDIYKPAGAEPTIGLWTMLGIFGATVVVSVAIIPALIYYVVKLSKEKSTMQH